MDIDDETGTYQPNKGKDNFGKIGRGSKAKEIITKSGITYEDLVFTEKKDDFADPQSPQRKRALIQR